MRRSVWVAKDSPRTSAGELQKIVESRGQKTLKTVVKQPLHHHMLFGRVSRKIILAHPKTNSNIFSYQTRLELQMGLASMVRWNQKISFLAANIWNKLLFFWCYGPIFLLEVLTHGIMDSIKYQQRKNQQVTEILYWAMSGSSNGTIIQTHTSKTTQKGVTEHKTKFLLWPFQSSDLNAVENEWGELKGRSTVIELEI